MSDFPKRNFKLSSERLALLKALLKEKGVDVSTSEITRRKSNDDLILSFAQERLWFLDQLMPGSPFYNIPIAIRLTGVLNTLALEQGLNELVERHEVLRTTFVVKDGRPIQEIASELVIPLAFIDLRALPKTEREVQALREGIDMARQPFNLAQGPLLRVVLFQTEDQEHVLFLIMHHIIADGWSIGILVREVAVFYEGTIAGNPIKLPELPIQYADFAQWQRHWLQGEVLDTQLAYWKQHLQAAPATLALPTDRPRPPAQTFRGALHHFTIPSALVEALKRLSRQEATTLFMTLLATFAVLLQRYSGQEEIVVGSPVANRGRPEIEGLIGFFVNTLALCIDLSGSPSFRELLKRTRSVALGAFAHQDLPFEKLVEELQPKRDLSRTPLFQVMFALQNAPLPTLEFSGLVLRPLEIDSGTAKFDLTLLMVEAEGRLLAALEYNSDLFDGATIVRMAGHLQVLLEGIVARPDQKISMLPLMTTRERQQLLVEWNSTGRDYPKELCLHQLFEAQVERTPDAIALVFEDQHLTYSELNERANQLAHYLCSLGVGPEVLVGICLERSVEMVVGLLAILKAGGAYVPLDPTYPKDRLAFMLHDTRVSVVLTQQALVPFIPLATDTVAVRIALFDGALTGAHGEHRSNLRPGLTGDHLAYVMYTSGSTGEPKGVSVTQRNVIRLVKATNYALLSAEQVWLQLAPITFDASTLEVWGALLNGARLVICPAHLLSLEELGQTLRAEQISILWLSAGLFHQMVEGNLEGLRGVNQLLAGGDVLATPQVLKVLYGLPHTQLINGYGPTECTTFTCCYSVRNEKALRSSVPIGQPIANTQVYILDHHLQPVPIGVVGELYIGGDGLARGYLNRPTLTAERFIPDPFSRAPGARLYKTGDRVRYFEDGNIEFIGRNDRQIKIRGFRVELGEIESVLAQHPGVIGSAAIALENHTDNKHNKYLVAYFVGTPETNPVELLSFLKMKLPEYMMPTVISSIANLPLLSNGKIDYGALPIPTTADLTPRKQELVLPGTPTEEIVASIWAEALGINQVGIHDNFFDLGGHSLVAIQVIARIRDRFSIELPVRRLFESPTIAKLSEYIEEALRNSETLPTLNIQHISREGTLPLSFAQEQLWFLDQLEGQNATYNVPTALELRGPLNIIALERSLNEVLQRHEILQTAFRIVGELPSQVIAPGLTISLPIVDLTGLSETERTRKAQDLAIEEAQRPFDLSAPPLLRVVLLYVANERHILLMTIHHIVSDGWSMGVIVREVASLYSAFCAGLPSPLPALPLQYADFAYWQRQRLQGKVLEEHLDYWKRQLAGSLPVLDLPSDHPRLPIRQFRGDSLAFEIGADLTFKLKALSRKSEVSLFMTLLAAFLVLLHRYSGQEDLIVGSPIANRNYREFEPLIGFFVNTIVLRVNLTQDLTFRELLTQVRKVALDAYHYRDLPFELLVKATQPERDPSYNPLFQVEFALQNMPTRRFELPGLVIAPLETKTFTAKFDLAWLMVEVEQGLRGTVEYSTDLFDGMAIEGLIRHYKTILEEVAEDRNQPISKLTLLTDAEKHQIVEIWNATSVEYPQESCFIPLFEAQVMLTPNQIAVVSEEGCLTYQELNTRSNLIAMELVKRNVISGTVIALLAERGIDLLIGILAIFKAGCAYLPLDPYHPTARLYQVLKQSKASFALATRTMAPKLLSEIDTLPLEMRPEILLLDSLQQPTQPDDNLTVNYRPCELAYVIYTSGSTGAPKGAMIEHKGMLNHLYAKIRDLKLTSADTIAQTASQSFDISIWQLLAPLLIGGRVYIFSDEVTRDPVRLLEQVEYCEVSILEVVPSLFRLMLQEIASYGLKHPGLPNLRWLLLTGEALPVDLCQQWFDYYPTIQLMNAYGPTECSDDVAHYILDLESLMDGHSVPIGRPVMNTELYVLDANLQPVPVGVTGELYVGGKGVGRGYLNDPDRTAQVFIPDPFSRRFGARIYKTGDMARLLPNGNIQFLGRIDYQVKVRGYRIELGEIEAVLRQHFSIREAVVIAHRDASDDTRLVAYVVAATEDVPPIREIRGFLKGRLPEYMVPAIYIILKAIPLTSTGKVDRKALPLPITDGSQYDSVFVEPRNERESRLVELWREVLSVKSIGVTDNFFDLGGDSFKAVRVVRRLNGAASLVDLFQNPTIESLARQMGDGNPQSHSVLQLFASLPANRFVTLVCLPYASGSAVIYYPLSKALPERYAVYSAALPGHDYGKSHESLESFEQVAKRCVEEIKAKVFGPLVLYGHCVGTALTVEIAHLLAKEKIEVKAIFLGGSLPFPEGNLPGFILNPFRHFISDESILKFLRSLDGFEDLEDPNDPEQIKFMLRSFRHDSFASLKYFDKYRKTGAIVKLKPPVIFIVGDHDPVTVNYATRIKEWRLFAETVDLEVIPGAGHFFVKDHAEEVAQIIVKRVDPLFISV